MLKLQNKMSNYIFTSTRYCGNHERYFRWPYLVEDRFLWTNKAPLEDLLSAVIEVHRQADVKDLTVVFRICVITVGSRVTTEGGGDALPDGGGVAGKS